MKKIIYSKAVLLLFSIFCWLSVAKTYAQNIGINGSGTNAHPSALLDIDATSTPSLGVLIPRIPLTAINVASPVTGPATSLLVYNTATASSGVTAVSPGYYYWDGTKWVRFAYNASGSSSTAWDLVGNFGTTSATNFLGTTDAQDLVFRTNNAEKMRILSNGNVGIGISNPTLLFEVRGASTNPQVLVGTTNVLSNRGSILFGRSSRWEVGSDILVNNSDNFFIYQASSGQYAFVIDNNRNVGINTITPATKLSIVAPTAGSGFQLQDGSEGTGKVLSSDATGKATWQSPSSLANYPFQSIGTLPIGANCPVGGTYATSTIVLPAGIYYYTNYSCDGQIGAPSPAGFNVSIQIVSGSGDSNGTFHDFNIGFGGSCGNYFTGIVRCFSPCTVCRVYTSYGGSSFTVPGANSEGTVFIKIL